MNVCFTYRWLLSIFIPMDLPNHEKRKHFKHYHNLLSFTAFIWFLKKDRLMDLYLGSNTSTFINRQDYLTLSSQVIFKGTSKLTLYSTEALLM